MTTWVMPKDIKEGHQLHLDGKHKHEENSERGMLRAINEGYDSWDGDLTKTLDKIILNNHWPDPLLHDGFTDPRGVFNRHSGYLVGQHPSRVTTRFVANPGHYVIRPIHARFQEAAMLVDAPDFVFSLEPKGRNWNTYDFDRMWEWAHQYERPTIIKCAYSGPLVAAHNVGFQVRYTVDHKPGM